MRVLEWIINRCDGKADAVETPIGYEPKPEDINLEGLDIDLETLKGLLSVDVDLWKEEAKGIHELLRQVRRSPAQGAGSPAGDPGGEP